MMEDAKPHCGLRPSRFKGMYRLASVTLCVRNFTDSSGGLFVVINPRTTNLSSGTSLSGAKEPERASSYSSKSRCAFRRANSSRLIAAYPPWDSHRLPWLPRQTWNPKVTLGKPSMMALSNSMPRESHWLRLQPSFS